MPLYGKNYCENFGLFFADDKAGYFHIKQLLTWRGIAIQNVVHGSNVPSYPEMGKKLVYGNIKFKDR